jgi:hypothetical protein
MVDMLVLRTLDLDPTIALLAAGGAGSATDSGAPRQFKRPPPPPSGPGMMNDIREETIEDW